MRRFLICLIFVLSTALVAEAQAAEGIIKEISVEEAEDTIGIILKTEGEVQVIAYDIVQPPQIIIDVVGDGLSSAEENISIHSGAVEQIKVVKSIAEVENYYGVDFWVVELTEQVDYKLSHYDDVYLLTLAKSGAVSLREKEVSEEGESFEEPQAFLPSASEEIDSFTSMPSMPPAPYKPQKRAIELRQKGYRYQMEEKYDKALKFYKKATEVDPYYATAYNDLGVLYYLHLHEPEEAIEQFKKALGVNPDYLGAHTNLALVYESLNRKEDARRHWEKRVRLGDPEDEWTKLAKKRLKELAE